MIYFSWKMQTVKWKVHFDRKKAG